ncbi:MAG: class I SAM-dependent methyltransferase [Alphaproteobacteria bacterium]|nr:class I SAM-dependent methyltransferase [Alphaproteobacteria bacterium]
MSEHTSINTNPFYQAYQRKGQGTVLKKKHVRQYMKDFVEASSFKPGMSVLELGCGNGLFLRFLDSIGVTDFEAVDGDSRVLGEIPEHLKDKVSISDFSSYFSRASANLRFDRVVLFDVLEHFSADGAAALLGEIATALAPGGKVVVRVPNMSSPLALGMQYNDVTHLSAFTPGSLSQVGRSAGFPQAEFFPQAYSSVSKEIRERILTKTVSWFLSAPPEIWSPAVIAVFSK